MFAAGLQTSLTWRFTDLIFSGNFFLTRCMILSCCPIPTGTREDFGWARARGHSPGIFLAPLGALRLLIYMRSGYFALVEKQKHPSVKRQGDWRHNGHVVPEMFVSFQKQHSALRPSDKWGQRMSQNQPPYLKKKFSFLKPTWIWSVWTTRESARKLRYFLK